MKRLLLPSLLILAVTGIFPLEAQDKPAVPPEPEKAEPKPTPRRSRTPMTSPEIHADGSVSFRLRANHAKEVKVRGQFGNETALSKNEDGGWETKVTGVKPGIYEYQFIVDGTVLIDPANSTMKPQRWPNTSILHVPASPPADWDWQPEIPHGTLHEHQWQSRSLHTLRRCVVYTPAGQPQGLPTLYLSHGFSDNDRSWSEHGKAHWICDALIQQKKAVPMNVVMMDAHALPPGPGWADDYAVQNTKALAVEVIEDLIPLMEKTYGAAVQPQKRAFAGLSMGGHHALAIALNHHSHFAWIGAFSAAPPPESLVHEALGQADKVNAGLKDLWIACGDKDFLFERNNQFTSLLKEKGIQHRYEITPGDDHSWPVWRRYLVRYVPGLFRD